MTFRALLALLALVATSGWVGAQIRDAANARPEIWNGEVDTDAGAIAPVTLPKPTGQQPLASKPHKYVFGFTFRALATDAADSVCTGTLVGPGLILTAGHCGCGIAGTYRVYLSAGHIPLKGAERSGYVPLAIPPILFNPGGCERPMRPGRDLALLRLSDGARKPYCHDGNCVRLTDETFLSLRQHLDLHRALTVVGFGYTDKGVIGERRYGIVKVASPDCWSGATKFHCEPFAEMVLGDSERHVDSCDGDSGGPVFLQRNGSESLVAIVSRGLPQSAKGACGGGGVYTIIGRKSVRRWLTAHGVPVDAAKPTRVAKDVVALTRTSEKDTGTPSVYGGLSNPFASK
jgi:hypothetical protein